MRTYYITRTSQRCCTLDPEFHNVQDGCVVDRSNVAAVKVQCNIITVQKNLLQGEGNASLGLALH